MANGPLVFGLAVILMGVFQIPFRKHWGEYAHSTWKTLGVKVLEKTPQFWSRMHWISIAIFWSIGLGFVLSGLINPPPYQ